MIFYYLLDMILFDSYEQDHKSEHWKKNYKKKLELFDEKYF